MIFEARAGGGRVLGPFQVVAGVERDVRFALVPQSIFFDELLFHGPSPLLAAHLLPVEVWPWTPASASHSTHWLLTPFRMTSHLSFLVPEAFTHWAALPTIAKPGVADLD